MLPKLSPVSASTVMAVVLPINGFDNFYSKSFQTPEMDAFEKGLMSPAEFRDYIRKITAHPLSDQQVDDIVNAILLDVPRDRVTLLLAVRQHYRTFLFSNTNQINYDHFYPLLLDRYGFDIFERCFERAYFSMFIHTRKPSTEGFLRIINENNLNPKETIFIDDIAVNAQAARQVGLYAHHLTEPDISYLFDKDFRLNPTFTV